MASLPTDLRSRTILGLSRAIGAEPPVAASPQTISPPATGTSSSVEDFAAHLGNLRPVGRITDAICIAAGEKAVARLKRKVTDLGARLDAARVNHPDSALVDKTAADLAQAQADLALFEQQVADMKRGAP